MATQQGFWRVNFLHNAWLELHCFSKNLPTPPSNLTLNKQVLGEIGADIHEDLEGLCTFLSLKFDAPDLEGGHVLLLTSNLGGQS